MQTENDWKLVAHLFPIFSLIALNVYNHVVVGGEVLTTRIEWIRLENIKNELLNVVVQTAG